MGLEQCQAGISIFVADGVLSANSQIIVIVVEKLGRKRIWRKRERTVNSDQLTVDRASRIFTKSLRRGGFKFGMRIVASQSPRYFVTPLPSSPIAIYSFPKSAIILNNPRHLC